jgi:hypothetical protein
VFPQTYTTDFEETENPISENGVWLNGKTDGLDWSDVAAYSGVAHGTATTVRYSDPTAVLKGTWADDQMAEATVYSVNQTGRLNQEVELRLRSSISPHSCTGYEIFFRCLKTPSAYTQIVRWNGPVADFTMLADKGGPEYGVTDGDVVKATIVGNVITAFINGVQMAQVTDDTFSSGNPGIGFNYGCNGTYQDFGLTNFTAKGIRRSAKNSSTVKPYDPLSFGQHAWNPFKSWTKSTWNFCSMDRTPFR